MTADDNSAARAAAYVLSADRRVLVIERRTPTGILTATFHRRHDAGPFTDADVTTALRLSPAATNMLAGQRNTTHRYDIGFGILWVEIMLGPPTWWVPRLKREKDGTLMAGWLRAAAAVKFERTRLPGGGVR